MAISLNDEYKKKHKPLKEGKSRYKQGYFIPEHPEKWVTQINEYRSSWEYGFMRYADRTPQIIRVGSEPLAVTYLDPVANLEHCHKNHLDPNNPVNWKRRKYYVDMWIEIQTENEPNKKIFIEIKPYKETIQPAPLKPDAKMKEIQRYNREMKTYLTNQAKWKAAKAEFTKRGCEFQVWTEKELKKLNCI